MEGEEWFRVVRATLGDLLADTTGVLDFIDPKQVQLADLVLGYRLALIGARDAVAIQLSRLELGLPLSEDEEWIALTLGDDLRTVEEFLVNFHPNQDSLERAKEYWLYAIVALLRRKWPGTTLDFPEQQYVELQNAWDGSSFLKSFLHTGAGLNRWYFGHAARRKFLSNLDDALVNEGARLDIVILGG